MYKLFLDDERDPKLVDDPNWREMMGLSSHRDTVHSKLLATLPNNWLVARTYIEALSIVQKMGFPDFVSFDNDLAEEKEGRHFAQYLIDYDMDYGGMPDNFEWEAHTANRIAREYINGLLSNYLDYKALWSDTSLPNVRNPNMGGAF